MDHVRYPQAELFDRSLTTRIQPLCVGQTKKKIKWLGLNSEYNKEDFELPIGIDKFDR